MPRLPPLCSRLPYSVSANPNASSSSGACHTLCVLYIDHTPRYYVRKAVFTLAMSVATP